MTILVIGTPDSGKSEKAEGLALELSGNGKKIYLATMIPYGAEGEKRIEKHRKLRDGKGFITVEKTHNVADIIDETGFIEIKRSEDKSKDKNEGPYRVEASDVTVLLECVSNLCANEMFDKTDERANERADERANERTDEIIGLSAEQAVKKIISDILKLRDCVKNLVIVTNEFAPEESFDEETLNYIKAVSSINEGLRRHVDKIYEKIKGVWKIYEDH